MEKKQIKLLKKKLKGMNLAVYEPYHGVYLTKAGQMIALEMLRHHRLVELYLAEALGVPWDKVHEEAEKWEHVLSEDLEDRIDQMLDVLRSVPANLGVESGRDAVGQATGVLVARSVIMVEGDRYRVRDRHVLRYYGRTLNHLLNHSSASSLTH